MIDNDSSSLFAWSDTTTHPKYPLQYIAADYFHHVGNHYLDRYFNWPIVEKEKDGSKGLIDILRRTFTTFGIPDELASVVLNLLHTKQIEF